MTLPVYALGFGDTYAQFFNAIAATMSNKSYGELIKLAVLLGGCWTIVVSSMKRNLGLNLKWLVTYVVIMSAILTPKVTVQIIDTTNPGHGRAVSNVPLGLGVLASFTSRIGVGLAQLVDDTFHTPNELDYTQSGMLMGAKLVLASTQFQVTGGDFQKNLQGFMNQCVFYDLLLHKYSLQTLSDSPNIWQLVTSQASPARAFVFNGKITTCQQGAKLLSKDWKTAIDNSGNRYAHMMFPNNKNAKAQLLSLLPTTYQYLASLSDDASTLMQQNMMIQAVRDGLGEWSSKINATSALQSIAFAKAQQQKREAYSILYRMAIYWLPLMQVVLELLLYGMFIIVVFMAFFPIGISVIKNYIYAMVWVQLWSPLFAFVNFIFNLAAEKSVSAATLLPSGAHGLTLSTFSGVDQMLLDLGKTAGFMAMTVPFLSSGIFFGLMRAFTSISQLLGGSAQSMSFAAAGEAVTGNLSLGNTQIDNHSANNMNANHFDTNARLSSGMMSYQLSGGSVASITPGGGMILNTQGGISNIPVRINMAESMSSTLSKMADHSYSTGLREAHSASESYSAGLRQLYELGSSKSHSQSSGTTSSLSSSGTFSSASREVHQLVDRFAHENHISNAEASRRLGAVYADAHATASWNLKDQLGGKVWNWMSGTNVSVSGTGGGKVEASHTTDKQHSEAFNQAASFAKEHNFNQAVDHALRAVHENNFKTGSEASNREAHSMASHFEQGNRYTQDAVNSFDQSDSYRDQAGLVTSQSMSIDTQASQEFVDWMMTQSAPGGRETMDAHTMEYIMTHEPQQREAYAQQFIQSRENSYIQKFEQQHSSDSIKTTFEKNNASISNQQTVNQSQQLNDSEISTMANTVNTGSVHDNVTKATDVVIQEAKAHARNTIEQDGNKIIQSIKDKEHK